MATLSRTFAVVSALLVPIAAPAEAPEYAVKAAYIYNFARFVDWPPTESFKTLTVCVYGKSPIAGFLDEVARGNTVRNLPIEIRRIAEEDENCGNCQIVFIGSATKTRIHSVLGALKGRPVLTIGESEEFAEFGGMLTLVIEGGRTRFDINLDSLAGAHLTASSKLIQLCRTVRKKK